MKTLAIKKLDWYIIRRFIFTFLIAILLIIGIVIIFDISEKIDDFVKNEAPLKAIIFDYYLNFIPYFMNMFSPLFVFITVIFFTSQMAANTEIIAMLSCGESFHRLMYPYMISAFLIFVLSLCLNLFIIPQSNKTRTEFENTYVKGSGAKTSKTNNIHYQINPGEFVYVRNFSTYNQTAYDFTLEKIEDGQIVSKLTAERAIWDSTRCCWTLKNWFIRDYDASLDD
ncbi:MAG: LptF/LptG family permease, partial [Bacteroidales bacterium]|nr:LptF/LptG family permease [Bacteroidales bacterium]